MLIGEHETCLMAQLHCPYLGRKIRWSERIYLRDMGAVVAPAACMSHQKLGTLRRWVGARCHGVSERLGMKTIEKNNCIRRQELHKILL